MALTSRQCLRHAEKCIAMADGAVGENAASLREMAETWLRLSEELLIQEHQFSISGDHHAPSTDRVQ